MLYNLQLCDSNYFDAYVCEFKKYYYKAEVFLATQNSLSFHNDMFFTKLPYPRSDLIFTRWKASDRPERTDTLRARIEFARITLAMQKSIQMKKTSKKSKEVKVPRPNVLSQ